jgi:drug/metabolite transporter (DMT)-like permease
MRKEAGGGRAIRSIATAPQSPRLPAAGALLRGLHPVTLAADTKPAHTESAIVGIGWMLVTVFWFVSLDAGAKYLLEFYPTAQVTWLRFFFALLFAIVVMAPTLRRELVSRKLSLQLLRSGLLAVTTGLFFVGIRTTPLATATSIMFLSPILVTVLSVPLLGETVGIRRLAGVAVGFLGAVIVVRPDVGGISSGALFLLGAAFTNSLYQIITRKVRIYDPPATTLFYTALVGAAVFAVPMPGQWVAPESLAHWGIFAFVGLAGGIGHLCLIRAFRAAPASVVAPFTYAGLVWSTLFGLVFFSELPGPRTYVGAGLIIAAGLYIFHRERRLKIA